MHCVTTKQLADTVSLAAKINKGSWDHVNSKYTILLHDAVQKAVTECNVPEGMWYPIYLMLSHSWNDVIAWAEHIKSGKPIDGMFSRPDSETRPEKKEL